MPVPLHPELIWAFDLREDRIGPIHQARDIRVEEQLFSEEMLSFEMLPDDPKLGWINIDRYVEYDGQAWRISNRKAVRKSSEYLIQWTALPLWYDLVDEVKFGSFVITNKTVVQGLQQILEGTSWTVASMSDPEGQYALEVENTSVLDLIRTWASITGFELDWDTTNREVIFTPSLGSDRNLGFSYGLNLDEVTQEFLPPQATRLYPRGAQDVTIQGVNGGIAYIENFSWYTDQGLTIDEARDLYLKEAIWEDPNFIQGLPLLDAAVVKLADWSQPTISYSCQVFDLANLTGSAHSDIEVGDVVWVHDETLGIDVRTRVVRLVRYPYHEWDNEVELSYLKPGFTSDLVSSFSSSSSGGSEWRLLVDETTGNNVAGSTASICQITFTSSGNTSAIIGGHIVGTATGTGTFETYIVVNSDVVGGTPTQQFSNGEILDFGIPTWVSALGEGNYTVELKARIVSGAGFITIGEFDGRLYVMANNTLGGGAGGFITNMIVSDTLWGDVFSPSGDGVTVQFLTDETASGSETLADDTVDPTDSPMTIDFA